MVTALSTLNHPNPNTLMTNDSSTDARTLGILWGLVPGIWSLAPTLSTRAVCYCATISLLLTSNHL